jgi:hypothetical protein
VHNQTKASPDEASRILIGGLGAIGNQETLVSEVPIRGFWSYYFDVMGLE